MYVSNTTKDTFNPNLLNKDQNSSNNSNSKKIEREEGGISKSNILPYAENKDRRASKLDERSQR